ETTALGAAYAAGLATGFWRDAAELRANWHEARRWSPSWTPDRRAGGYAGWRKAVRRTLDWVDVGELSRTTRRVPPLPPAPPPPPPPPPERPPRSVSDAPPGGVSA